MKAPVLPLLIAFIFLLNPSFAQTNGNPVKFGNIYTNTSYAVGHIGNQIFLGKDSKWTYAFTLPFTTDGGDFKIKDRDVIMYNRGDSVFYYSIESRKLLGLNAVNELRNFSLGGIKKIVFTRIWGSCWKVGKEEMVYTLQNNRYVLTEDNFDAAARTRFIHDCPDSIEQSKVAGFVQKIPTIYAKKIRADELDFTREEYDSCKRSILKLKSLYEAGIKEDYYYAWNIKNPDFSQLMAFVDSVKTMSPELLHRYFLRETDLLIHYRFTIKLENNGGKELEFKSDDYTSLGFYCPWEMKMNNFYSVNTAVEINRFIKDVYPDFLRDENRAAIIQGLVKLLYREWDYAE